MVLQAVEDVVQGGGEVGASGGLLSPDIVGYQSVVYTEIHILPLRNQAMQIVKAGIREFRAGLAEYIQDGSPVAVTRHGQTVGVFIPTQTGETVDMAALEQASSALDALLSMHRIDPEELVDEFKSARREARTGARKRVMEGPR